MKRRFSNEVKQKEPRSNRRYFNEDHETKNFYTNESKTIIDFTRSQPRRTSGKPIELIPQSINQEQYIVALTNPEIDIVVVSGPAGTGKTYLGMLAAIRAMKQGKCDKLILTRPAVPADGEQHGFLPGDLNQKMEPWVRPLFDILREYYTATELEYMIKEQVIEITPLAFCRGRTFKNAWIICDEMQNATPNMIKMLMTRIGEKSKIVITGDIDQTDRITSDNGLMDLINRIQNYNVPGMVSCTFDNRDIRRHKIIEHVLKMYA